MNIVTLELLFWYHVRCEDHPRLNLSVPAVMEGMHFLLQNELIQTQIKTKENSASYTTTARGRVYIEAIKKLPLPVKAWVMPVPAPGSWP